MFVTGSMALALAMQTTGDVEQRLEDGGSRWVVEYPLIIEPLVSDYRRCLNYADRRFRGQADFESQHAADIPRCEKQKVKLVEKSEEALRQGRWSEVLAPEKAGDVFWTVGEIHISRGRAFDRQLMAMYVEQTNRVIDTDLKNEKLENRAQNN